VLLNSCKALFPCILFLEDIDIKFKDREERVGSLAGFLLETFEGLSQAEKIVLIATSNNVDVIEKALLRPGRIDYPIEIKKPSKSAKELVLSKYLDGLDFNLPLYLKETLINSVDTFAELKGAFQHVLRTYVSAGDFPPVEEVTKMIRIWKEAKVVGVSGERERKIGIV
jgi:SpoVK/Ycf46/Vps4 family AAA+-type ATPase